MEKKEKYFTLIEQLVKDKFYGEVLTKFESGNIVIIKKTESIKLQTVKGGT